MNKKVLIGISAVILIAVVAIGIFFLTNSKVSKNDRDNEPNTNETSNVNDNQTTEKNTNEEDNNQDTTQAKGKILVVYYSAQNHTRTVAEKIAKNLNSDTFEIVPVDVYSSDDLNWTNDNSRVSKEHNDESLRNVKLKNTKVDNWNEYDTVLIGYPIWWGIAAWPVNNFIKENNFDGKTVIPFCTSVSSGIGQSGDLLKDLAGSGTWLDGTRFSSSASDNDIKEFTDNIK